MKQTKHNQSAGEIGSKFKRSALTMCIMAATSTAFAQEVVEEILVTGTRQNVADAAAIKREAATHVDAISAKDIGALPDASVLEAVQRIPGISIERFNAADDPDHFSVEGSGLTLRGLPQTRSEFNGRDSFSANSGRGLTFQDVSPELMGAVEIIKNSTADMVEGGISGTVNLNTRKPFDSDERILSFRAAANYSDHRHDSVGDATPSYSGVFSDRWDIAAGEIGLLLSYADADLEFRSDGIQGGLWEDQAIDSLGGEFRYVPRNAGLRSTEIDRERTGTSAVLQFSDTGDNVLITAEYFKQEGGADWRDVAFTLDDDSSAPGADAVYNDTEFVSGTLVGTDGMRTEMRRQNNRSSVEDFSLNVEWNATDAVKVIFDAQYVDATTDVVDLSTFGKMQVDTVADFSGAVPNVEFQAPGVGSDLEANSAYFTDELNYFHVAAMDHLEESEGTESAFKVDVEWDIDSEVVDSVMFGARFAKREQTTRWTTYNWKILSEGWNGDGSKVYFDGTVDNTPWDGTVTEARTVDLGETYTHGFDNFFRGGAGTGIVGGQLLAPPPSSVDTYASFLDWTSNFPGDGGNGFASVGTRGSDENPLVDNYYLSPERNIVTEENTAAYARLNFSNHSDSLIGNVGLRWISQDTTTKGGATFPTFSDGQLPFISADDAAFANGGINNADIVSDYSAVLPSLNLRYSLNEDMYIRFAASQSISYPDMGLIRYSTPISVNTTSIKDGEGDAAPVIDVIIDEYQSEAGNPYLKPMESNNYDLSYEWYFGDASSFATGIFFKEISNFFGTASSIQDYTNNGVTRPVDVYGPVNSGDGNLKGFEVAYNQFWDNGFGIQTNYTYLKDENIPNQNVRPVEIDTRDGTTAVAFPGLPLEGLSEDTFNITGIYEKEAFSARIAYNYRSAYMLTQSQANLKVPIFSDATENVDMSMFYDINDNFQVGLTINNVFDEVVGTTAQVDADGTKLPRAYFMNDRRYALVFVGNF